MGKDAASSSSSSSSQYTETNVTNITDSYNKPVNVARNYENVGNVTFALPSGTASASPLDVISSSAGSSTLNLWPIAMAVVAVVVIGFTIRFLRK